jgi:hypothetical protein
MLAKNFIKVLVRLRKPWGVAQRRIFTRGKNTNPACYALYARLIKTGYCDLNPNANGNMSLSITMAQLADGHID